MTEFKERMQKVWRWGALGAPLWWILGLNLAIYHAFAVLLFLFYLYAEGREREGFRFSGSALFLSLVSVTYFFTIVIHAVAGPSSRVVAAFYNLSFWIMGVMLSLVMAYIFTPASISFFMRVFSVLAWMTGLLALAMFLVSLTGVRELVFPTPLYGLSSLVGKRTLAENSLLIKPLFWDWFASLSRPRFNVFSPYPNAASGVIMILLMMILTRAAIEKRLFSIPFLLLFGMNMLALIMTLSRIAILALLFSLVIVFLLEKRKSYLWIVLVTIGLLATAPWLVKTMDYFLDLRPGSIEGRLELYRYSLEQLEGVDWLLGIGLKARNESVYPLASHSTYLSLLCKSGLVGTTLFILFQVLLILRWFRLKPLAVRQRQTFLFWRGLGWVFLGMAVWMTAEDIDAPQLLAFVYFSLVGTFEGFRKRLVRKEYLL